ncbi:uncharacterized short protein YbdD (DUF466 family) [Staphylococcus hominis]
MYYKTSIYDQHILIQLLILLEKAKYYYFMDIAHLSLGIEDYNNFINHCLSHFKHNQLDTIPSHNSDSQMDFFKQYNELVINLKQIPLHNFNNGNLIIDLQERQNHIYKVYNQISDYQ